MRVSKLISLILHPIFMPLLALHLILIMLPELAFTIGKKFSLIYFIIIVSSIILPLFSVLILIKLGKVRSLEMMCHKERVLPLFSMATCMLFGFFFIERIILYTPLLIPAYLGAIIIISLAGVISNFWKISLHMLGIGGVLGLIIALQLLYKNDVFLIIVFILISGILASARLNENAHNKSQIYIGLLIGVLTEMIIVLNY